MHFVHRSHKPSETIAAIATPPGEGGIAVIRISGEEAIGVASRVFSRSVHDFKSHTVHVGKILDKRGIALDDVLLLIMRAPRSFTGEDVVEIHCHGGSLMSRKVLERVLQAGARAAEPGEFSLRAFMHGKIDLAQAEAIQELIAAKNDLSLGAAHEQLQGALSKRITFFQQAFTDCAAILEAWVDFPEEGLEFASLDEIILKLETTLAQMEKLHATFHEGKLLKEGISLCLVGPPNAGKSSLMNALLGKERAIVTDIPGTTRDLLEEEMRLGSLHFRLFDTAGIRETAEVIEQEGIRRTKVAMEEADLVLLVLDVAYPVGQEALDLFAQVPLGKTLLVWNKIDMPHVNVPEIPHLPFVCISAKLKEGLDQLCQMIEQMIWREGLPSKEEIILTNVRHKEALGRAIVSCQSVVEGLKTGISPEFVSADMRQTLIELGTIIGTDITEEILSAIFSKFCVGK